MFTKSSPELCYSIGMFLTDGWIRKEYKTKKPVTVAYVSTTSVLIEYLFECFLFLGQNPKLQKPQSKFTRSHKGNKTLYTIHINSTQFATWLLNITDSKKVIPQFIFTAPVEDKLSFIAGMIDGDGRVRKDGSIEIRMTADCLLQLPVLAESIGIRSGIRVERILDSGKIYRSCRIRRSDYRSIGGTCIHPIKSERILYAKDNRIRN